MFGRKLIFRVSGYGRLSWHLRIRLLDSGHNFCECRRQFVTAPDPRRLLLTTLQDRQHQLELRKGWSTNAVALEQPILETATSPPSPRTAVGKKAKPNKTDVSSEEQKELDQLRLATIKKQFVSRLSAFVYACSLAASRELGRRNTESFFRYLDTAQNTLVYYRRQINGKSAKASTYSLQDPELFNTILLCWLQSPRTAQSYDERKLRNCLKLRKLMVDCEVQPNETTLAAFYLLQRQVNSSRATGVKFQRDIKAVSELVNELRTTIQCSASVLQDPRIGEKDLPVLFQLVTGVHPTPTHSADNQLLKALNDKNAEIASSPSCSQVSDSELVLNCSKQQLLDDFVCQLNREKRGVVVVPSAFVSEYESPSVYNDVYDHIYQLWRRQLKDAFVERRKRIDCEIGRHRINIAPFLHLLCDDGYVELMHDEAVHLLDASEYHGIPLRRLATALGARLADRIQVETAERDGVLRKIARVYTQYADYFCDPTHRQTQNQRQYWQKSMADVEPLNPSLNVDAVRFDDYVVSELGDFLYQIIIDSLTVPDSLSGVVQALKSKKLDRLTYSSAFYKAMANFGVRCFEEVRPHRTLAHLKKLVVRRDVRFNINEMPTICPPIPWHRIDRGQLLISNVDFVRIEPVGARALKRVETITPRHNDLLPVLDALNELGGTPWKINQPVLDVMLAIFRGDGDPKLDIPTPPHLLPSLPQFNVSESEEDRIASVKQRNTIKKENDEMYSLWCTAHYRFSMAAYLRDKTFWFPHNLDFRGRAYPVPPYMNHMGDDVCRGMLQFAKGKPLGSNGLRWLKIHCINLTGLKKRNSIDERATYADEILDDILDSARDPLFGRRWWAQSEEPWQTLACCMEIEKALKCDDPAKYVSYFPVHQDGSCNGLQHYAALGRDIQGAQQVNLAPGDIPQDIYSAVAARIEEKRAADAEAGLRIAAVLNGFVRRKVIKQTVMTTVYGVTRYGGRAQIARQLKDIDDFPNEYVFKGSAYLVQRLFDSIGEIFTSARLIQNWFVDSSRLIAGQLGRTMEWVTPLGFPVAQPYFRPVRRCKWVSNDHGSLNILSRKPVVFDYLEKPNPHKQKNAFPPNYIHSLDSTHMMLTALYCGAEGITYAAVHDSYWTHACDVAVMNEICRQQFVALHEQPLLQNLSRFFIEHYVEPLEATSMDEKRRHELANIRKHFEMLPSLGHFDLQSVNDSTYFFS